MVSIKLTQLALTLGLAQAAIPDEVTSLPGVNFKLPFKHYSGYLKALNGNNLHYWFFESQNNTQLDPVVLWLNGGPGCSSLMGALTELGPLRMVSNQSLALNPYAWNVRNSLLFLESPAGVGFSYNDHGNYTTSDDQTAANNYAALLSFFEKYPHLQKNDFYITGESYGGIYVPTLSVIVLEKKIPQNFKGFAVGNALLDSKLLSNSIFHFAHYHGLFDDVVWNEIVTNCCHNVTNTRYCNFTQDKSPQCQKKLSKVSFGSHLNLYNIYNKCYESKKFVQSFDQHLMVQALLQGNMTQFYAISHGETPPCLDQDDTIDFLNQASVKKALHINSNASEWAPCSPINYKSTYESTKDQVHKLITAGLKGLIYNGDVDLTCNFLSDMWFAEELGFKVTKEYSAWMYDGQVAGFAKVFGNLTYTTIRGSGHMVPTDKPGPAQHMFYKFLLV